MYKNRLLSIFFLVCFALFAGHDFFPHKHVEVDEHSYIADRGHSHGDHNQQHDHSTSQNDHDKDGSIEDDLINIYSFIPHTVNTFVTIHHAAQIELLKVKCTSLISECIINYCDLKPDIP